MSFEVLVIFCLMLSITC